MGDQGVGSAAIDFWIQSYVARRVGEEQQLEELTAAVLQDDIADGAAQAEAPAAASTKSAALQKTPGKAPEATARHSIIPGREGISSGLLKGFARDCQLGKWFSQREPYGLWSWRSNIPTFLMDPLTALRPTGLPTAAWFLSRYPS